MEVDFNAVLEQHSAWLTGDSQGVKANLQGADLRGLVLEPSLGISLQQADLRGADLQEASLSWVNLGSADLREVNLRGAKLRNINFQHSDLRNATFEDAELRDVYFNGADLHGADFYKATFFHVDFSQAIGLLDQSAWLKENFTMSPDGLIVYKIFGDSAEYDEWGDVSPGQELSENVNPSPAEEFGCGVSFATLDSIKRGHKFRVKDGKAFVYECILPPFVQVVVPYNTTGWARAAKLIVRRQMTLAELGF